MRSTTAADAPLGKFTWRDFQNRYASYSMTDLSPILHDIFLLPKKDQKNPIVKKGLFLRLLQQPVADRNFLLHDIGLTQEMTFEAIRDEFVAFAEETERLRENPTLKAPPVRLSKRAKKEEAPDEPEAPLTSRLADIEPQPVSWLWPDFIPSGSATLLSGDPGCAKTWFALDIAARLSRGTKWIDGCPIERAANTIYLSIEDDAACALRPRFDSLGGDPSRLFAYNPRQAEHLNLAKLGGLDRLDGEIEKIGDVRLVVVDPIADFSGDTNPNAGEEVRALLGPLIEMATRHGFALLLVGHLNKAQSMSAIYRAAGATSGWLGICRAAFMAFRDIDDRKLRHVVALKANYAHDDPPQIEFRIDKGQLEGRVAIEAVDIDEQLAPKIGRRPREKDAAVDWLAALFDDRNEIPAQEIEELAKEKGFCSRTLKRAKASAGIISKRSKLPDGSIGWTWQRITISEAANE